MSWCQNDTGGRLRVIERERERNPEHSSVNTPNTSTPACDDQTSYVCATTRALIQNVKSRSIKRNLDIKIKIKTERPETKEKFSNAEYIGRGNARIRCGGIRFE
ncbi:hypothetical protein TNCV_3594371 [Trichonephila clavipes]|nr:hypothetical protein TNCV_3594371 [Trichonephila clavipes]